MKKANNSNFCENEYLHTSYTEDVNLLFHDYTSLTLEFMPLFSSLLLFPWTKLIFPLQYLDENKQLILAILENQNLGKLAECAQ
jgi:hypothetical protein